MAHFAEIDSNNIVLRVVVVDNKDTADANGVEKEHIGAAHLEKILGGTWKQTSYNSNFRKNYAGIGFSFDSVRNAFIPPQPYLSWTLNEDTCEWDPPIPYPTDGKVYSWNDAQTKWDELVF